VPDERDAEVEAEALGRVLAQSGGHPRVAHEGVEAAAAEACAEGGGEGVDARKPREVKLHRHRSSLGPGCIRRCARALELGGDERGGRLGLGEVAAGEDDCRAEPGELGGGVQPDATVGTGHNAHFAAEVRAGQEQSSGLIA